jgi:regulator of replication initiation timing
MAMPKSTTVDLEPIDRLEEKVRLLVATLDRLRADHARALDENSRLTRDLDGLRAQMAEFEGSASEVAGLRQERDRIRTRVVEMLDQLEALNL